MMSLIFLMVLGWSDAPQNQPDPSWTCDFDTEASDLVRYLGIKIYNARLELSDGADDAHCARLEITYLRNFKKDQIRKASDKALKKQQGDKLAQIQDTYESLNQAMNAVKKGDRYSMTYCTINGFVLEYNDQPVWRTDDDQFAQAYMAIWLHPKYPIDKGLRRELLGDKPWPLQSSR